MISWASDIDKPNKREEIIQKLINLGFTREELLAIGEAYQDGYNDVMQQHERRQRARTKLNRH